MKHLEKLNRKKLGEILIDEGLISTTQLDDAMRHRERTGEPLGYILVDCSFLPEEDLARIVTHQYQLPYVELTTVPANKDLEELLPMRDVVTQRLLPIEKFGSVVSIAVAEMPDLAVLEDLRQRTGLTPFLYVAMLSEIDRHISAWLESKGVSVGDVAQKKENQEVLSSVFGEEDSEKSAISDSENSAVSDSEQSLISNDDGSITIEAPNLAEGDWENLFDDANDEVLKELTE